MKELKEGPITLRELSNWFGLQPDAISKGTQAAKEKKFEKLKLFCDYHLEGKKIIIDEVFIPKYSKDLEIIEDEFEYEWGCVIDQETKRPNWQHKARIDTTDRVGEGIQYKYLRDVQPEVANYVSRIKTKWYGRPHKQERGTKGSCRVVYLNQDESGLLPEAQMEIMRQCRLEAYSDVNEQRYKIDEARIAGEINEKEWREAMGEVDTEGAYVRFQSLLLERLGFVPARRLQLIDEEMP